MSQLLRHWPAKLGSVLAAAVVWYLLHRAIPVESTPVPPIPGASGRFP